MAFDPPPTQATTVPGRAPVSVSICSRDSTPMTDWKSATISGYGAGPTAEPMM